MIRVLRNTATNTRPLAEWSWSGGREASPVSGLDSGRSRIAPLIDAALSFVLDHESLPGAETFGGDEFDDL